MRLLILFCSVIAMATGYRPPFTGNGSLQTTIDLPPIQFPFHAGTGGDLNRSAAVKNVIERTWSLYSKKAFGSDEIQPVNGTGVTTRNGWGAMIVDGLDALLITNLTSDFIKAVEFALTIDFSKADGLVFPFETIIRYLGGLVATADLVNFLPGAPQGYSSQLTAQAVILADKLAPGLDTPTGLWLNNVNFAESVGVPDDTDGETTTSPAKSGSNILEYGRLSEQSGNLVYINNATRAWWPFVQPKTESILPGMSGQPVSVSTGEQTSQYEWGSGEDSYYEYLIKSFVLWPNNNTALYRDRWTLALGSTMTNLTSKTLEIPQFPSVTMLALYSEGKKQNLMRHLTCFAPGNFLLGGRVLGRQDIFEYGLEVLEGCWHAYNATPAGIAPEEWQWKSDDTSDSPPDSTSAKEQKQMGFWGTNTQYLSRPEFAESLFYAYRLTGNTTYQERAWDIFQQITAATETNFGYSSIDNVMTIGGGDKLNVEETFWLAETLKYLFLIFDDPQRVSLDDWVFNTEGHPLRRR